MASLARPALPLRRPRGARARRERSGCFTCGWYVVLWTLGTFGALSLSGLGSRVPASRPSVGVLGAVRGRVWPQSHQRDLCERPCTVRGEVQQYVSGLIRLQPYSFLFVPPPPRATAWDGGARARNGAAHAREGRAGRTARPCEQRTLSSMTATCQLYVRSCVCMPGGDHGRHALGAVGRPTPKVRADRHATLCEVCEPRSATAIARQAPMGQRPSGVLCLGEYAG